MPSNPNQDDHFRKNQSSHLDNRSGGGEANCIGVDRLYEYSEVKRLPKVKLRMLKRYPTLWAAMALVVIFAGCGLSAIMFFGKPNNEGENWKIVNERQFRNTLEMLKFHSSEVQQLKADKPSTWTLLYEQFAKAGKCPYETKGRPLLVGCDITHDTFREYTSVQMNVFLAWPPAGERSPIPMDMDTQLDMRLDVFAPNDQSKVILSDVFSHGASDWLIHCMSFLLDPKKREHAVFFDPNWDGRISIRFKGTSVNLVANRINYQKRE